MAEEIQHLPWKEERSMTMRAVEYATLEAWAAAGDWLRGVHIEECFLGSRPWISSSSQHARSGMNSRPVKPNVIQCEYNVHLLLELWHKADCSLAPSSGLTTRTS